MIQLAPPSVAPPATQTLPGVASRRVVFVDLARALAVVFMLYGHAISALLAPEYQTGTWFELWQFQRGLTAALFLLLAGFAFSIATSRRWSSHLTLSRAVARRVGRFGLFVLLGYGLHFPVGSVFALAEASDAQWRGLLAVDVLQLVGTTFIAVQALVLVARSRAAFAGLAAGLAVLIMAATPFVWRTDWSGVLPLWAASFLSPATGSLFPLFPWAAYVLAGAALGQVFMRWGVADVPRFANVVLLGTGGLLLVCGRVLQLNQVQLFGADAYSYVPPEVCTRAGACLVIVGLIAHASRFIRRVPAAWNAVAQETLVIYFVHLCIVYGSIWNPGLVWAVGPTLTPGPTIVVVVTLVASMVVLASVWHGIKQHTPRRARWIAAAAGGAMLLRLV